MTPEYSAEEHIENMKREIAKRQLEHELSLFVIGEPLKPKDEPKKRLSLKDRVRIRRMLRRVFKKPRY